MNDRQSLDQDKISLKRAKICRLISDTSKEALEKVSYTYSFSNKKKTITTTKNNRIAIDEIAYGQLKTELVTILLIFFDLTKKAKEQKIEQKITSILVSGEGIRRKFEELSQQDEPDLTALSSLLATKEWSDLLSQLNEIVAEGKKSQLSDDILTHCKELKIWLNGIHLHCCIYIKRKSIQSIVHDQKSQDLVLHPAEEGEMKSVKISKGIFNALDLISKLGREEVIPIIIGILEDYSRKVREHTDSKNQSSIDALQYALKIFYDAKEIVNCAYTVQYEYTKKNKDRIGPDLDFFVEECKKIEVQENTLALCEELVLWLEGYYLHSYKERNNLIDKVSFATSGVLTTMKIATYYHKAALEIDASRGAMYESIFGLKDINNNNPSEENVSISDVNDSPISAPISSPIDIVIKNNPSDDDRRQSSIEEDVSGLFGSEDEKDDFNLIQTDEELVSSFGVTVDKSHATNYQDYNGWINVSSVDDANGLQKENDDHFSIDSDMLIQEKMHQGKNYLVIDMTSHRNKIAEATQYFRNNIFDANMEFWQILNKAKQGSDDQKIKSLFDALSQFKLNSAHLEQLEDLPVNARRAMHVYKNDTLTRKMIDSIPIFGTYISDYLEYYIQRCHADIADDILKTINTNNLTKLLLDLLTARSIVIERKSDKLYTAINGLLIMAYQELLKLKPVYAASSSPLQQSSLFMQVITGSPKEEKKQQNKFK